jgi:DNA-binding phage protein
MREVPAMPPLPAPFYYQSVKGKTSFETVTSNLVKEGLRIWIERVGGISKIAEAAGFSQASLSRVLSTTFMPRQETLVRLISTLLVASVTKLKEQGKVIEDRGIIEPEAEEPKGDR